MPKWNPLGRLVTEQKAAPPCQLKLPLLPRAAPVSLPLCASSQAPTTGTAARPRECTGSWSRARSAWKKQRCRVFPLCRLVSGWLCWCRSPVGGRKGNTLNRDCSRAWGSPRLRVRCWELCFPRSFPAARPGAAQPPAPGSLLTLTHSHRPWS